MYVRNFLYLLFHVEAKTWRVSFVQGERLQLVLGAGKQEAEGKLLWLMIAQKDKYDKWLFRVLVVLSELLVRPTTVIVARTYSSTSTV